MVFSAPPCPLADAEFARFESDNTCALAGTPQDTVFAYDVGIGINSPISSNSKGGTWGAAYNPAHQYTVAFPGTGAAISLNYHDGFYPDNSGSLTVEIFAPQAASASANVPVPMLDGWSMVALLALVAASGLFLLRGRA